jgi:hypothetical protein
MLDINSVDPEQKVVKPSYKFHETADIKFQLRSAPAQNCENCNLLNKLSLSDIQN